ncbi:MAG: hypothetical protein UT63_C0023G0014 [Candidatus Gottesmanbacteria bacterium GW2011_GWC2_39_8]|uniref:Uncharacterized protein n=1 Tax=Candidatus Gottesmanbacteria bacterium GW2011_GWC2_39_8 TaxID=1618450 RepID=A0A0G0Q762_9BACT|nr:MAG: hypothetical protein UT63_C0023G0014 [Candidatus Gottesmanbacteria bacterium GW2011_GWC2_39_8]
MAAVSMTLLMPVVTLAAPTNENKAENNPQVVAYYTEGEHGVPPESDTHTGTDLVMQAGESGNFQQWFLGLNEETGKNEGAHSLWKNVGTDTTCPNGWTLVPDANPEWGDYLEPGANFCVHTNHFQVEK